MATPQNKQELITDLQALKGNKRFSHETLVAMAEVLVSSEQLDQQLEQRLADRPTLEDLNQAIGDLNLDIELASSLTDTGKAAPAELVKSGLDDLQSQVDNKVSQQQIAGAIDLATISKYDKTRPYLKGEQFILNGRVFEVKAPITFNSDLPDWFYVKSISPVTINTTLTKAQADNTELYPYDSAYFSDINKQVTNLSFTVRYADSLLNDELQKDTLSTYRSAFVIDRPQMYLELPLVPEIKPELDYIMPILSKRINGTLTMVSTPRFPFHVKIKVFLTDDLPTSVHNSNYIDKIRFNIPFVLGQKDRSKYILGDSSAIYVTYDNRIEIITGLSQKNEFRFIEIRGSGANKNPYNTYTIHPKNTLV